MLIEITYNVTDVYMSTTETPVYVEISFEQPGGGAAVWGSITGTLSNQTDLQNALNAKFDDPTGTTSQYIRGDGTLATFPTIPSGTVTSVGLSMPIAFSVANSPVTSSGTLAVTGAGTADQYIRGDGQLANFPTNGGGGSSVNYYLNGSVSQGTFGGDTYYEMSKTPIIGAGTNFTRTNAQGNGYIASFITDAGDPALLNIPGGNWNLEFYFAASSGGGTPSFYAELYKVSSSNIFTLISSGSTNPEGITNGTVIDQYFTSIPVPQTSLLSTDRLAIRIFVTPDGRNITLHTEDNNLCEVLTTFSTGLNALNGLTSQVQYFATGTSGTDFAINSATDTHTFNIPFASGTNTGKLSNTDWTTFNNKVPSSRTITINGVTYDLSADRTWTVAGGLSGSGAAGQVTYWTGASAVSGSNNLFWDNANGRLGIGTNAPASPLHITATAVTLTRESIIRATVSDDAVSSFIVTNGTSSNGLFAPAFGGFCNSPSVYSLGFTGFTDVTNDAADSPINLGLVNFLAARTTNTSDPYNGTLSDPVSRRLFTFGNLTNSNMLTIFANGSVGINTVALPSVRFQVTGDTLLRGSGNTSATTALTVQNSDSSNLFRVRNDGRLTIGANASAPYIQGSSAGNPLLTGGNLLFYNFVAPSSSGAWWFTGDNATATSGTQIAINLEYAFTPSSGTAQYRGFQISGNINQTGGANGVTRGLYVNPTLTAAADFRAIEVSAGVTVLAPSVTARASLRIPSGTAPTSPVNGDIWFDGTNIQMRIGGVTKTFTLI